MLKREYFELHKELKNRIKGKIYIGVKGDVHTVNIRGYRNITFKTTIDKIVDIVKDADRLEREYHRFILDKFFVRRRKKSLCGRKR